MHCLQRWQSVTVLILLFLLGTQANVVATEVQPMAIRRWPGGAISLETHWGLNFAINPTTKAAKQFLRKADQAVNTSHRVGHVLSRMPNKAKPSWLPASEVTRADTNALAVKSVRLGDDNGFSVVLDVDGVRIVFIPYDTFESRGEFDTGTLKDIDLLILSTGKSTQLADPRSVSLVASLGPKLIVLNPVGTAQPQGVNKFKAAIGAEDDILTIDHNTFAFSRTTRTSAKPRIVTLTDSPWKMPDELEKLFAAMEKASSDSRQVFAKLSTNQMNFKPGNGTHTPRWNTEHMMGRQLLFFSQLYHAQNPSIQVMDLNPKQMPPDYVFAHPDWDGREEARQMERVSEFTRRFAYLLADLDVDEKALGSDWPSLRALLNQMHRHYSEHTANTIKKFDLPGWPTE
jgi:hypothetical protein